VQFMFSLPKKKKKLRFINGFDVPLSLFCNMLSLFPHCCYICLVAA
jgi:hypothetical protein